MLGNVVVGMTILGPAGMLAELAVGLGVGIHDTGLLVTYGAVVLCIGSPVMAWLTTRIDRRVLLVVTLAVLAIGQAASALTSNYSVILLLRLIMLAIGARRDLELSVLEEMRKGPLSSGLLPTPSHS